MAHAGRARQKSGGIINGETVLQAKDGRFAYGMVGLAKFSRGRTLFGGLTVEELG